MCRIRWLVVSVIAILFIGHLPAQKKQGDSSHISKPYYEHQGGNFSLGLRNTISAFSHGDSKEVGAGVGGHFRLQLVDRVNTEWYADILHQCWR